MFNVCHVAAMLTASAVALSYAWCGKPAFSLGGAFTAAQAFSLRRWIVIPRVPHVPALAPP